MSRFLLSTLSSFRVSRPLVQLRLSSTNGNAGANGDPPANPSGKICPEPPGNTCEPAIGAPPPSIVCTTKAAKTKPVRVDEEFDACLHAQIANPMPACTTPTFMNFSCEKSPMPKSRGKKEAEKFPSAWEKVQCCNFAKCKLTPLRHDLLYLEPTKKCWRRSWREWESVCLVEKQKCEPPKFVVDPPEYRERIPYVRPKEKHCKKWNPCEPEPPRPSGQINKAATSDQPKVAMDLCPRIRLPGCKPCNASVRCSSAIQPKCCQKRCTQYPSFSECCRKNYDDGKDKECGCITSVTTCNMFMRMKQLAEQLA